MLDLTGTPIMTCICGCKMFVITVMWDEESREVSWYDLRQECKECGAISTAPTPIDWKDSQCLAGHFEHSNRSKQATAMGEPSR